MSGRIDHRSDNRSDHAQLGNIEGVSVVCTKRRSWVDLSIFHCPKLIEKQRAGAPAAPRFCGSFFNDFDGFAPHSLRHLSCVFVQAELQQDYSLSFLRVKVSRRCEEFAAWRGNSRLLCDLTATAAGSITSFSGRLPQEEANWRGRGSIAKGAGEPKRKRGLQSSARPDAACGPV